MGEASYELCATPLEFLGLTSAQGEDGQRVLLTSVVDGVQLFHPERRVCLQSWSSPPGEKLTSPCIFHNGRLFAVQNEKVLCSWDPSGSLSPPVSSRSSSSSSSSSLIVSTPTSFTKHRKFPHPISKLHANPINPSEIIVLFANGVVAVVSANPDPQAAPPLLDTVVMSNIPRGKGNLVTSCVAHSKGKTFVAYLRLPPAGKDHKTDCYMSIYSIHTSPQGGRKIDESGQLGFRAPRQEEVKGGAVSPVAFDFQPESRTVGLAWGNGLFQALKFDSAAEFVKPQEVLVRPLHNFQVPSISLAFVGLNFVGITGQTLSGDNQFLVLETLYGTQSATLSLSPSPSSSSKKRKLASPSLLASSTAVSSDGQYCFCVLDSVSVVRLPSLLPAQSASLAVALGQFKTPVSTQIVPGRLDLHNLLQNGANLPAIESAAQVCNRSEASLLDVLESGDGSAIEEAFAPFLVPARPSFTPGAVLSHNLINVLATRTLELSCWPVFQLVLQSQLFSARTLPNVVSVLIEHKQIRCLELCVSNVPDLSEDQLVQVLQYALSVDPPIFSLVDAVLAARHSDSFLHDALKYLPTQSFAFLLGYLVEWFEKYWQASDENTYVVSLTQVANWCSVLLDANVVELLLPSSPFHRQLSGLRAAVRRHLSLVGALSQSADVLQALCASIASKRVGNKVEAGPPLADYSIEFLPL